MSKFVIVDAGRLGIQKDPQELVLLFTFKGRLLICQVKVARQEGASLTRGGVAVLFCSGIQGIR